MEKQEWPHIHTCRDPSRLAEDCITLKARLAKNTFSLHFLKLSRSTKLGTRVLNPSSTVIKLYISHGEPHKQ